MFQTVLFWCQAEILTESTTEVVRGLKARYAGNRDDLFVGFAQHFSGELEADVAQFLHGCTDKVLSEGLLQTAARHGNVSDDVGHTDRKVCVFLDVLQGRGNPRVIDRHAVGAATFNNTGWWDVDWTRWRRFTSDQSLEKCSTFVSNLLEVVVDT